MKQDAVLSRPIVGPFGSVIPRSARTSAIGLKSSVVQATPVGALSGPVRQRSGSYSSVGPLSVAAASGVGAERTEKVALPGPCAKAARELAASFASAASEYVLDRPPQREAAKAALSKLETNVRLHS